MEKGNFKTDTRLWLILSLALFVPLWFIPWFGIGESDRAIDYVRAIGSKESLTMIKLTVFFFFFYGIPAVVVAWALQALIVVVHAGKRANDETV